MAKIKVSDFSILLFLGLTVFGIFWVADVHTDNNQLTEELRVSNKQFEELVSQSKVKFAQKKDSIELWRGRAIEQRKLHNEEREQREFYQEKYEICSGSLANAGDTLAARDIQVANFQADTVTRNEEIAVAHEQTETALNQRNAARMISARRQETLIGVMAQLAKSSAMLTLYKQSAIWVAPKSYSGLRYRPDPIPVLYGSIGTARDRVVEVNMKRPSGRNKMLKTTEFKSDPASETGAPLTEGNRVRSKKDSPKQPVVGPAEVPADALPHDKVPWYIFLFLTPFGGFIAYIFYLRWKYPGKVRANAREGTMKGNSRSEPEGKTTSRETDSPNF